MPILILILVSSLHTDASRLPSLTNHSLTGPGNTTDTSTSRAATGNSVVGKAKGDISSCRALKHAHDHSENGRGAYWQRAIHNRVVFITLLKSPTTKNTCALRSTTAF